MIGEIISGAIVALGHILADLLGGKIDEQAAMARARTEIEDIFDHIEDVEKKEWDIVRGDDETNP